ncbi:MAG: tetratricopeptide repeat protein [Acidobacteriota bacterium]
MKELSPPRWRLAEKIFEEAVALSPGERAAFLDRSLADDADLRRVVEELLAVDPGDDSTHRRVDEMPVFDRYRVESFLGSGGMGRVYLCRRRDEGLAQRLAVKVLRDGGRADSLLRECRILSRLAHPNIARFLDAGTTGAGQPYVAMEYVEGLPLTEFCDTRRLPIAERLKLFRRVCQAVEHAHQQLIVHRDLKPSNILVTDEGEPRLLDFGIAKYLAAEAGDETTQRFLTPGYASPEVLQGGEATRVSDVYSLGVVLCELLYGHRPTGDSSSVEPVAGAAHLRRSTPRRLRIELSGDLERIVQTSLVDDPVERYDSVAALDRDLGRYLQGLPIAARGPTLVYRLGKLVQRRRWATAALLLAGLASLVAMGSLWRADRQVARAEQASQRVSDLLAGVLSFTDPYDNPDLARDGEGADLDRMLLFAAQQLRRDLADQPVLQARLLADLGDAAFHRGNLDEGLALLEESWRLARDVLGRSHPVTFDRLEAVILALFDAGRFAPAAQHLTRLEPMQTQPDHRLRRLDLEGRLLYYRGDFPGAEAAFRRAAQGFAGRGDRREALTVMNLAWALSLQRDLPAAEEQLERSRGLLAEAGLLGTPDEARWLYFLKVVRVRQGRAEEAVELMRRSLEIRRRTQGAFHPETVTAVATMGETLFRQGDFEGARRLLEEALAGDLRLRGEDHPEVAKDLQSLALVSWELGDLEQARAYSERALGQALKVWGPADRGTLSYHRTLAGLDLAAGRLGQAESRLVETIRRQAEVLGPEHRSTCHSRLYLAEVLMQQRGRLAEALEEAELAHRAIAAAVPPRHWLLGFARSAHGAVLSRAGCREQALEWLEEGHRTVLRERGERSRLTRAAAARLAAHHLRSESSPAGEGGKCAALAGMERSR